MTLQRTKLADIQYIASSAASLYSNSSGYTTYIKGVTIFNGNTTTEVVKLYYVPDSGGSVGTAGVSNQCFEASIVAKETVIFEFPGLGIVLTDSNDSLQGVTTTASKVTIIIHGDKAV